MTKHGTPPAVSDRRPSRAWACPESGASSPTHDSNRSPRMYSASAPRASVLRNSTNWPVMSGRPASMCKSEMKSIATLVSPTWRTVTRGEPGSRCRRWNAFDLQDHDRLQRRVLLERALGAGRHGGDLIDHVHPLHDLAEHRITPAGLAGIERRIVGQVHVELNVAGMGLRRARESDGAALIGQAISGFIDDL